jgi:hypothetical protein
LKAKTIKQIAIVPVLAAICVLVGYYLSYPIKLNTDTLPEYIQEFYSRGRSSVSAPIIQVYDGVSLGNKEYYLVEVGEDLGTVTLEKGLTGQYKITHLSYGDGNFEDGIIESNGKKYLLFGGRDITSQIYKITVSVNGQTYELGDGTAKDHFLFCTEIDGFVEDNHVDRTTISIYDENGENITERCNLSGGGIQ